MLNVAGITKEKGRDCGHGFDSHQVKKTQKAVRAQLRVLATGRVLP